MSRKHQAATFLDPRIKSPHDPKGMTALTATPVSPGKPKWLRKLLRASGADPYEWQRWEDHGGTTVTLDGRECYVGEPYSLSSEDVEEVQAFARRLGLTYSIEAASAWYPTRTLRVVLYPPDGEGAGQEKQDVSCD